MAFREVESGELRRGRSGHLDLALVHLFTLVLETISDLSTQYFLYCS